MISMPDGAKKDKHYQCEHCKRWFTEAWTDDEANAEFLTNFPTRADEDRVRVCQKCYERFMNWWMNKQRAN